MRSIRLPFQEGMAASNGCDRQSDFVFPNQAGKVLEGTVVGLLGVGWETAGGQVPGTEVIAEAFAANALALARFVGARAPLQVFCLVALHGSQPQSLRLRWLATTSSSRQA